ncbi:MAG: hypothetical protein LQ351_001616 [Letrouitia transgressa]|nr:MAG: hypothetical protein LQ351_001616 [Letrouitia transgressa]
MPLTILERLEAATSRLEDMVPAMAENASPNGAPPTLNGGLAVEQADLRSGSSPSPAPSTPLPASVDDFDALINGDVKTFVNMSEEIGGLVAEQSAALLRAFAAERKFLIITTKAKKPDIQSPTYMEVLKDLQSTMGAVNDIREANRASPLFTHLTTVSEGVNVLGWFANESKPTESISDALRSAEFYGNRVIKEYKDKDRTHVQWTQAFYRIFKSLTAYVKHHYPSGLTWNNEGIDPLDALQEVYQSKSPTSPPSARSATSAPPPPPPPPPLPSFDNVPPPPMPPNGVSSTRNASDMTAVFDEISKGEAVTSNLRKVDPSSQTHKNPSLRAGSAVPSGPLRSDSQNSASSRGKSPVPGKKPKPESMRTKKTPRKELEGNKWFIENFDGNPPEGMLEINASITQSILISRCSKTTIRVKGKGNAITLDNCKQVALVIDSLVSSVDVIKTPRVEMQVLGNLPTIMLDQVDGATIILGKESLGTELFTSKCTGINVNVPGERDEDDFVEMALPEQVKSVIKNGQLVNEIVEYAG